MYKINAEKSIGLPRLVPAALERPSSSWRGTVISAPEKTTLGNEPASMGMPNTDDRDLGRRVDDDKRSTGTVEIENGATDHNCGGAPTEGGRLGTASWPLHRRPRVEAPDPTLGIG